jgi:hypothetical protein
METAHHLVLISILIVMYLVLIALLSRCYKSVQIFFLNEILQFTFQSIGVTFPEKC